MDRMTPRLQGLAVLVLFLCTFILSGCIPLVVIREVGYRPSPSDPYELWGALITDSGLLVVCGSVDNGLESMDRVVRYYNLELRLGETPDLPRSDAIEVIRINDHPSLQLVKGYLSDLCQFDEKRATQKPDETGWTEIFMNNWDEGFVRITPSDLEAGRLPTPPAEPRVVLYQVYDSNPPQYLLMGRLREGGPERRILLVLGPEHIEAMW